MSKNYTRLKLACYTTNISMSVVSNFPPLLFLTFRDMYGISYSQLGFLVVLNFLTQLLVDLSFSFFSHKFNIEKAVKFTPALTVAGLLIYALWPLFLPEYIYAGLILGTVVFSASNGFCEVLISPVIAAIPAEDPDREMSKLHSIYAWGVVLVIGIATIYFLTVGAIYWQYLTLLFAFIPLSSFLLFQGVAIPKMQTPEKVSGALSFLKNKVVWLFILLIFLGGATECTMAQWASGYLEQALGIPKMWGDLFGVALFAMMLGLGRSLYAKIGKNIGRVLLLGFSGAAVCYLLAAVCDVPLIGLLACGFTGLCASMLWPGSLIAATDRLPSSGVILFALMAAGGDLGASVGPQLVGLITDAAIASPTLQSLAETLELLPVQLGMKLGMLTGMIFPVLGIPVVLQVLKRRNHE